MVDTIVDETDNDAVSLLVNRCDLRVLPFNARVLGFRDADGIRGAFCFERYTGVNGSVHAHWAGRDTGWLRPYMLTLAFMYAYDQLQCTRIFGEVRASLIYVRRVNEKIGFTRVATLPGYFAGDDLIIYQLLKRDCKWLPAEFKEAS